MCVRLLPCPRDVQGQARIKRDGHTITWDAFWASDSPWLVNGAARMRFTLALPD